MYVCNFISSVPTYNSPEHKFVVLHLVEAQSANLTQRKVRQAEVVEVEEGSNNVFECMVVFLLLTLIFIGKCDTLCVCTCFYMYQCTYDVYVASK